MTDIRKCLHLYKRWLGQRSSICKSFVSQSTKGTTWNQVLIESSGAQGDFVARRTLQATCRILSRWNSGTSDFLYTPSIRRWHGFSRLPACLNHYRKRDSRIIGCHFLLPFPSGIEPSHQTRNMHPTLHRFVFSQTSRKNRLKPSLSSCVVLDL